MRPPSLQKTSICCHEPGQHWCYQPGGMGDLLAGFPRQDLGIGNKIAMQGSGQIETDFNGLVIGQRFDFELQHLFSFSVRLEDQIAIHDHSDRKSRSNCQGRLNVQITSYHLLPCLVQRIGRT